MSSGLCEFGCVVMCLLCRWVCLCAFVGSLFCFILFVFFVFLFTFRSVKSTDNAGGTRGCGCFCKNDFD